jgi:hypothetical protein
MRSAISIILLSFMVSCASSQGITTIQYKTKKVVESSKNTTYSMSVPKGYKLITLVGGHSELEKQYVYSDSTKIYISDFGNSMLSYSNILSLGDSIANKRFEGLELKAKIAKELGKEYNPETLILQGKAPNGLYWKDIRVGYLSIGYVNVPENRKMQFDKALSSFMEK